MSLPDFDSEAWNIERQKAEDAIEAAVEHWWRLTGQPGRVFFPANKVGLTITIVHIGPNPKAG
jgi:hypothetical protein